MIKVKKTTLIKSLALIATGLVIFTITMMAIFSGTVKIPVSKGQIDTILSEKLPIEKTIDLKEMKSFKMKIISKYVPNPTVIVDRVDTKFKKNEIDTITTGKVLIGNKVINFSVNAIGRPVYRELEDHTFHFLPSKIKTETDNPPSKIVRDYIMNKVKKQRALEDQSSTEVLETTEEEKPRSKFSSFLNKTKEKLSNMKKAVSNKTKHIKEDALLSIVELIEEPQYIDHKREVNNFIIGYAEKLVIKHLNKQPIYKLKDNFKENSVKVSLKNIYVMDNGIEIELSLSKIFGYVITIFGIIIFFGILIYWIIRNPKDVLFGFIEITGAVLEGTANGIGSVADGISSV